MSNSTDYEKGAEIRRKLTGGHVGQAAEAVAEMVPDFEKMLVEVVFGKVWARPGLHPPRHLPERAAPSERPFMRPSSCPGAGEFTARTGPWCGRSVWGALRNNAPARGRQAADSER